MCWGMHMGGYMLFFKLSLPLVSFCLSLSLSLFLSFSNCKIISEHTPKSFQLRWFQLYNERNNVDNEMVLMIVHKPFHYPEVKFWHINEWDLAV